ncbi:MAG: pyridoxal phosphate-dependent aminotransferase [Acidaminococcaceae bacterium]
MTVFKARKGLEEIEEYTVEHSEADIIVNANECNWSLPPVVQSEIAEAAKSFPFNRYPPMKGERLCQLLAADFGVDQSNVQLGNGSSELLQMACYAFGGSGRKIAFPVPSFSMYGVYTKLSDSKSLPYNLNAEGYLDAKEVIAFCEREKPDLLIICNPNNPTGNYNSLWQIEKILASVDCAVIMDEAYLEFAGGYEADFAGSAMTLLAKYDNFICLRTFSKAYGLASMRVGYAIGSRELMRILGKVLLPYHVNAFSLLAAEIVYKHKQFFVERTNQIIAERENMRNALAELGFKVWDSATNFLMFTALPELAAKLSLFGKGEGLVTEDGSSVKLAGQTVFRFLANRKILARDFTRNAALEGGIRLTLGTPEENAIILAMIKEVCKKAGGV